jgi:hypothetical protein
LYKAIQVLSQVKVKSNVYIDLVRLDDGTFAARVYKTSKARTQQAGTHPGNFRTIHHKAAEYINSGNSFSFYDLDAAKAEYERMLSDRKSSKFETTVAQCRVLKLFNWD